MGYTENQAKIMNELGYDIRVKPITTAPKTPEESQIRDRFQTPNYATDLIIPFLKARKFTTIWECACGDGKIVQRLTENGFSVYPSDIKKSDGWVNNHISNFLIDKEPYSEYDCIVTNPPLSIKYEFIEKAFEYKKPFAFLINADYSQKTIELIRRGCQKLVPTSRIAYITPNILKRIHEGTIWEIVKHEFKEYNSLGELCDKENNIYLDVMEQYKNWNNYKSIDDVPQELLYKYSSAQFHSMWLTYGLDLGASEVFVDLTVKQRKENI